MSNPYAPLDNTNGGVAGQPAYAAPHIAPGGVAAPYQQPYQPQPQYQPQYQPQQPQGQVPYGVPVAGGYAGQQPMYNQAGQPQQYVIPVAGGATMGQPGHLPRGLWSDGICDCFDSLTICILSWCISPLRWASTMERIRFMQYSHALLAYGLPWLLMYIFQFVFDATALWPFILLAMACNIIQIYLGTKYRTQLREHYQIPGSQCEDCLLHTFCQCCSVAQEARHVDRDHAIPL